MKLNRLDYHYFMKISFLDFWTGFDKKNNFIVHSLKKIGLNFRIVSPRRADIIFFSCFGNQNENFDNCKKIFFLTEDFNLSNFNYDYSISHKETSVDTNNFRLPLWKMYIDWFNVKTYKNPSYLIPLNYIDQNNEFSKVQKNKFCTIVYSSEYFFRDQYIELISGYKNVDVYGKNKYGNLLPEGEYYKIQHLANYKFSLAMENEISPGYLCEKLIHAKIAGNIPLFYGDDFAKIDFNPDSFLHITDFTEDNLLEKIVEIDNDDKLFEEIKNQPLFDSSQSIDDFLDYLENIIN